MMQLSWSAGVPGVGRSPMVVGDSVINVTYGRFTHKYHVIARDRFTGDVRWCTDLREGGYSRSAADEGTIYVPTGYSGIGALDLETGRIRWTHELGARLRNSIVLHEDGLYVAVANRLVVLDSATGDVHRERAHEGYFFFGEPHVLEDVVYQQAAVRRDGSSAVNKLVRLRRATGEIEWEVTVGDAIVQTADYAGVDSDDSAVFCGSRNGDVQAFALRDGSLMWSYRAPCGVTRVRPMHAEGRVYVTTLKGHLAVLDASSGTPILERRLDPEGIWAPPLLHRGRLFVHAGPSLHELDPLTGDGVSAVVIGHTPYTMAVPADDWIYITGGDPPDDGSIFGLTLDREPELLIEARPCLPDSIRVDVRPVHRETGLDEVTLDARLFGCGSAMPLRRQGDGSFGGVVPIIKREKLNGRVPVVGRAEAASGAIYASTEVDLRQPLDLPDRVLLDIPHFVQETPMSSGPASLRALLAYYGREQSSEAIARKADWTIRCSGLDPHHKWRAGAIRVLQSHGEQIDASRDDRRQLLATLYSTLDVPFVERRTTAQSSLEKGRSSDEFR
jgi:outer membrane protein assembly factor BamB